jgi:hypothetical protein
MPHARHDRGSPRHRLGAVGRVSACAPWSHFQKAGRASALSGFICPTWLVRLQPLQPFQGPLAQSARALACRAKGSGSITRTDRHFQRARSDRRQHGCFAHSRRRSVTVRVHHFRILGDLTVGCLSVKAAAMVRMPCAIAHHKKRSHLAWPQATHPEEPVQECGAVLWTASSSSAETAESHSFQSLRSSTAEHPPDKRETVEHHHAEGPFFESSLGFSPISCG